MANSIQELPTLPVDVEPLSHSRAGHSGLAPPGDPVFLFVLPEMTSKTRKTRHGMSRSSTFFRRLYHIDACLDPEQSQTESSLGILSTVCPKRVFRFGEVAGEVSEKPRS